ncbi:hypothetical protein [Ectopseudomonas oleovorans]|uniref:hypothetical protein n=1 Tax=Ectopseudomonas oleovorans TaxID=301 RepID=UPI003F199890
MTASSQGGGAAAGLALLLEQRSRAGVPVLRLDYPQGYEVISEHLRLAAAEAGASVS